MYYFRSKLQDLLLHNLITSKISFRVFNIIGVNVDQLFQEYKILDLLFQEYILE